MIRVRGIATSRDARHIGIEVTSGASAAAGLSPCAWMPVSGTGMTSKIQQIRLAPIPLQGKTLYGAIRRSNASASGRASNDASLLRSLVKIASASSVLPASTSACAR